MNFPKEGALALMLSVGLHAAAGWTLFGHGDRDLAATDSVIEIAVHSNEPADVQPPSADTKTPTLKKVRGIPVPKYKTPRPASLNKPSDLQRSIESKIKNQEAELARLSAAPDVPEQSVQPKTSSELLTDPVQGKIFVGYFGEVKHQIQEMLAKKYASRAIGYGSVYLFFVLDSRGELEKISVVDKLSTADEYLRALAIQCLKEAAPFGNFPKDLQIPRISFNVTVFFEENNP